MSDLTGYSGRLEQPVHVPMSMEWVSDELLQDTIEVWSKAYRRPISVDEAVEILGNVKHFASALMNFDKELQR